jgi:hypothetical protein
MLFEEQVALPQSKWLIIRTVLLEQAKGLEFWI